MNEREVLLIMTLCELLGKTVKGRDVQKAYESAIKGLELEHRGPRDAR
jgi:hypothetical protein